MVKSKNVGEFTTLNIKEKCYESKQHIVNCEYAKNVFLVYPFPQWQSDNYGTTQNGFPLNIILSMTLTDKMSTKKIEIQ